MTGGGLVRVPWGKADWNCFARLAAVRTANAGQAGDVQRRREVPSATRAGPPPAEINAPPLSDLAKQGRPRLISSAIHFARSDGEHARQALSTIACHLRDSKQRPTAKELSAVVSEFGRSVAGQTTEARAVLAALGKRLHCIDPRDFSTALYGLRGHSDTPEVRLFLGDLLRAVRNTDTTQRSIVFDQRDIALSLFGVRRMSDSTEVRSLCKLLSTRRHARLVPGDEEPDQGLLAMALGGLGEKGDSKEMRRLLAVLLSRTKSARRIQGWTPGNLVVALSGLARNDSKAVSRILSLVVQSACRKARWSPSQLGDVTVPLRARVSSAEGEQVLKFAAWLLSRATLEGGIVRALCTMLHHLQATDGESMSLQMFFSAWIAKMRMVIESHRMGYGEVVEAEVVASALQGVRSMRDTPSVRQVLECVGELSLRAAPPPDINSHLALCLHGLRHKTHSPEGRGILRSLLPLMPGLVVPLSAKHATEAFHGLYPSYKSPHPEVAEVLRRLIEVVDSPGRIDGIEDPRESAFLISGAWRHGALPEMYNTLLASAHAACQAGEWTLGAQALHGIRNAAITPGTRALLSRVASGMRPNTELGPEGLNAALGGIRWHAEHPESNEVLAALFPKLAPAVSAADPTQLSHALFHMGQYRGTYGEHMPFVQTLADVISERRSEFQVDSAAYALRGIRAAPAAESSRRMIRALVPRLWV
eukprot:Hpha_TRINITY_DN18391_c0_g1::TRINITY_DN18391_c0_g1_i1::g.158130::m.158130